jgi:hypothetical protein
MVTSAEIADLFKDDVEKKLEVGKDLIATSNRILSVIFQKAREHLDVVFRIGISRTKLDILLKRSFTYNGQ